MILNIPPETWAFVVGWVGAMLATDWILKRFGK